MKTLTIISGKGGTGKTSIVGSLRVLAKNAVFADCDVDAADLSLIIDARIKTTRDFKASQKARIDVATCIQCGDCEHACHFNAIRDSKVDHYLCEGCRVCSLVCPQEAISMDDVCSGQLFVSDTPYGPSFMQGLNRVRRTQASLLRSYGKQQSRSHVMKISNILSSTAPLASGVL